MSVFNRFIRNESGATAIEYSLIAAFIATVIITAVSAVGTEVTSTFNGVETGLKKRVTVT